MVNLELYRAFYSVAKTGSLTAAARELFVSQPALSQSVMALEQQLGGQLFIRTQKGMTLTPEGQDIFPYVEQALHTFLSAENYFLQLKHLAAGSIRIGASDTLCRHFLLRHIADFHSRYPNVNIEVTNRTTMQTLALLRSGKVDVAFVNLPLMDNGGECEQEFSVHRLMPLHDCLAGSGKYYGVHIDSPEDLKNLPLIMMETASNTRCHFDMFMEKQGVVIKPEIELGSFDLVVEFAKAGLGVGCVTREFITGELENETLFELETGFGFPERAIGGITRKDLSPTYAALKFMEIIFPKQI